MNYRHHFHAGNFADVLKHAVLVRLVRALQKKEKGFLYLDTHAGRGRYDLEVAARGDTLARKPEWPDGIGRLWTRPDLPEAVADYVSLVRGFDQRMGNLTASPRIYPGSPSLVREIARPQERITLCEKHPDECAALRNELGWEKRVGILEIDGYTALRGQLPPPEKRALVLIDPPFEERNEFARIVDGLADGLRRLPSGTFAVWYPLTERARVDVFLAELADLAPPPTLTVEIMVVGIEHELKMKGCGVAIVNPPWQIDRELRPLARWLSDALRLAPGGGAELRWIVPEK